MALTVQVPQVGVANATEEPKITNSLTNLATWANGGIAGSDLSSGAAAANVGALGGDLTGTLPNPTLGTLGLAKFLQLTAVKPLAMDFGSGSVTWSASQVSATVTVNHALTRVPVIVLLSTTALSLLVSWGWASPTTTTFQVNGTLASSFTGGPVAFGWLAIG